MEVYSYSWTGYRYLIFLLSIVHVVMSLVIKSLLNYHREVLHSVIQRNTILTVYCP